MRRDEQFRQQPSLFDTPAAAAATPPPPYDHGKAHRRQVWDSIQPKLPAERQAVLDIVTQAGQRGATGLEIAHAMRKHHHQISGRITELARDGRIVRPGVKRSAHGQTFLVCYAPQFAPKP
jgi:hypothetical protein